MVDGFQTPVRLSGSGPIWVRCHEPVASDIYTKSFMTNHDGVQDNDASGKPRSLAQVVPTNTGSATAATPTSTTQDLPGKRDQRDLPCSSWYVVESD